MGFSVTITRERELATLGSPSPALFKYSRIPTVTITCDCGYKESWQPELFRGHAWKCLCGKDYMVSGEEVHVGENGNIHIVDVHMFKGLTKHGYMQVSNEQVVCDGCLRVVPRTLLVFGHVCEFCYDRSLLYMNERMHNQLHESLAQYEH